MTSFSQRIGLKPVRMDLQLGSMDDGLRVTLWNHIIDLYLPKLSYPVREIERWRIGGVRVWRDFFKRPMDTMPSFIPHAYNEVRDWCFKASWNEVYDLIEFLAQPENPRAVELLNQCLERELSGYRMLAGRITAITDEHELESVTDALNSCDEGSLRSTRTHLTTAVAHISRRDSPDYRNSIKESISAVESLCVTISGNPKATLGDALATMERTGILQLHGALKSGFSSLYGYTSDANGIRHALLDDAEPDFEDAKYMLVSCSAFINYLIAKAIKAGVNFT